MAAVVGCRSVCVKKGCANTPARLQTMTVASPSLAAAHPLTVCGGLLLLAPLLNFDWRQLCTQERRHAATCMPASRRLLRMVCFRDGFCLRTCKRRVVWVLGRRPSSAMAWCAVNAVAAAAHVAGRDVSRSVLSRAAMVLCVVWLAGVLVARWHVCTSVMLPCVSW